MFIIPFPSSNVGLSQTSLQAVSKLLDSPEYAEDVISVMRCVITQFTVKDLENESIEVPVHVKLWRVNGCHELLASLGMLGIKLKDYRFYCLFIFGELETSDTFKIHYARKHYQLQCL